MVGLCYHRVVAVPRAPLSWGVRALAAHSSKKSWAPPPRSGCLLRVCFPRVLPSSFLSNHHHDLWCCWPPALRPRFAVSSFRLALTFLFCFPRSRRTLCDIPRCRSSASPPWFWRSSKLGLNPTLHFPTLISPECPPILFPAPIVSSRNTTTSRIPADMVPYCLVARFARPPAKSAPK